MLKKARKFIQDDDYGLASMFWLYCIVLTLISKGDEFLALVIIKIITLIGSLMSTKK